MVQLLSSAVKYLMLLKVVYNNSVSNCTMLCPSPFLHVPFILGGVHHTTSLVYTPLLLPTMHIPNNIHVIDTKHCVLLEKRCTYPVSRL